MKTPFIIATAAILMVPTNAAEIKVLSTQATEEAYRELVPLISCGGGELGTLMNSPRPLRNREI
jgi:hypothetical protein